MSLRYALLQATSNAMHEMRATAIDDPVVWASVSPSRGRLLLLIRQMAPLRWGRYYITIATC